MKIYRIAKRNFIEDLSGEGARLYGGRWNRKGHSMLYFSEHLSLSVLEILVHTVQQLITNDYWFLEVEISEKDIVNVQLKDLPNNWRTNSLISETQDFGTNWLLKDNELAVRIPSAVLPFENNILINPKHLRFSSLRVAGISELNIDARL